ncbi:MAG: ParB/RepB/Spo0J family partition protein [Lachnospiraceae bacterium]|nr:ParB/RepB/Spo0J family partition protein [Lachnospiraceae bacterium]
MSRSIAGKIKINSFADLVGGDDTAICEIPLTDLHPFKDHPFKVLDDEKMVETVKSVREHGVLMPGIVRPRIEGGYEIIAGHRRKRACEIVGLMTMPMVIKNYTDDEAVIAMVDTNLQRESILPSEKAKAYRMRYEAEKHQGSKGGNTLDKLGENFGESGKTVQRYITLSYLSDGLLELVDERKIPVTAGITIAVLKPKEQDMVENCIRDSGIILQGYQANKLAEWSQKSGLTKSTIEVILSDAKPKPRTFVMKSDRISEFFEDDITDEEIEETIIRLLKEWRSGINQ